MTFLYVDDVLYLSLFNAYPAYLFLVPVSNYHLSFKLIGGKMCDPAREREKAI